MSDGQAMGGDADPAVARDQTDLATRTASPSFFKQSAPPRHSFAHTACATPSVFIH